MKKNNRIAIIGGGISGLSSACYAAKAGYQVTIIEKNNSLGGRARQFKTENGFIFDMGPSWYWMPDIIENFFQDFGESTKDYFHLELLDPQFEIIFKDQNISFPSDYTEMKNLFESLEKGASKKLDDFMHIAKNKYDIGMNDFVSKPCLSVFEFFSLDIIKNSVKLDLLTDFRTYVNKYFENPLLRAIMEFPVIFLGSSPKNIPALYSLMNYGGYKLGTWYPMGGFHEIIKAMTTIAEKNGVEIRTSQAIEQINVKDNSVKSLTINGKSEEFDYIISSADYHHTEKLLPKQYRNYSDEYWAKKTFAPSCLIFYIGVDRIIPNLTHHTLFFEEDFDQHIDEIYETPKWPTSPLFYACCPSKTDPSVAPSGNENLFLLMPIAINLEDSEEQREIYFDMMLDRIEKKTGIQNLKDHIVYKKSYCVDDFKTDYNAYGGNAYGLANTLNQTAFLKPKVKNKHIKNLIYTGQLTVPGPGVPPSLISGKIAANLINN